MKFPPIFLIALIIVIVISVYVVETRIFETVQRPEHTVEGDGYELGESMIATQLHHSKLWFEGEAKNWELATYELDEMQEGFDDAIKQHPVFRKNISVAETIDKYMVKPMSQVRSAIEAKDSMQFENAFDNLTRGCNACHREVKHDFIVIQRPSNSLFSNQDLRSERN